MTEQINNTQATENENMSVETVVAETVTIENTLPEKNPGELTAKEIFDQIVNLQRQMMDSSYNALYRLTEAINGICNDDCFESDESRCDAINSVSTAFYMREETYKQMLNFYQQTYSDLKPRNEVKHAERAEFMQWVRDCIAASEPGIDLPDFEKLWKAMT